MAAKGPGSSAQSLTVLQRTARLYEGERWWLFDGRGEVRGLLLFDGGEDLACLRDDIGRPTTQGYRFSLAQSSTPQGGIGLNPRSTVEGKSAARNNPPSSSSSRPDLIRPDCQVTVEERTQLFGLLKKG
jgi:hypothetical protein